MPITAKRAVITSTVVDCLDIIINLTVALITGSVVMLVETIQGVSDLTTDIFLLIGLHRSKLPPDKTKPFGYGKEAFFWTLLAAIIILVFTAGLTIYFGFKRYLNPLPATQLFLAYGALTLSFLINGYSFSLSLRRILGSKKLTRFPREFFTSPLALTKTTFILDFVGSIAALIGLVALILYGITGNMRFDGLGAILIGVILILLSIILIIGLKDFLIGTAAPAATISQIKKVVRRTKEVNDILDLRTMYLGPEKILVNLELHFANNLTTDQIEKLIDHIKADLMNQVPLIGHVQIELETPEKNT
jgi:cation diffusion facilitator family transporter